MKSTAKRAISIVLTLAILLSAFAAFSLTSSAATYPYNTGRRNAVCTSLSSQAVSYYATNGTSYEKLSAQKGDTLKATLCDLMTKTQTKVTTYAELRTLSIYSDTTAGTTNRMSLLYSNDSISGTWDSGKTWNREHVWPQSRGTFTTSDAGSDLHHLRPADSKVNNTRGNLPYGEVQDSTPCYEAESGNNTLSGYYNQKYFEPLDNAKGDVARILLYVYVRWGETNLSGVCSSTDMLLKWMKNDPVDEWEMSRNDVVEEIEGNRNVFIDYPELAWLIFGKEIPKDMKTPSGKASGSSSGGTTEPTEPGSVYQLVTSASQLKEGASVVISTTVANVAMCDVQSANNRGKVDIAKKSDNTITMGQGVAEFTLGKGTSSGTYSLYDSKNGGYLSAASSSANYLRTQKSLTENSSWKISVTASGAATLTAQGNYTRNGLRYNKVSRVFSCYSTTQSPIALYIKTAAPSGGSGTGTGSGETTSSGDYQLVTSTSQLKKGDSVVIAAANANCAISTDPKNNNRAQATIQKNSDKTISLVGAVAEFTVDSGAYTNTFSFYDSTTKGYLCAASSSANYLRTRATVDGNASWAISIASNGEATMTAKGSYTRNSLRYNAKSKLFSCYASGQGSLALYVKSSGSTSGGTSSGNTYSLVTNTSNLTGGKYVFVVKAGGKNHGSSTYFALKKAMDGSSYVASTSADSFMTTGAAPDSIAVDDSTIVWTLTGGSTSFTLTDGGSKALYNSSNNLYWKEGTASKWKATYNSGSKTFQISSNGRYLGLRDDLALSSTTHNPRFRCNSTGTNSSYQFYIYKSNG